ncbi:gp53-like domain-containing protein [Fusobacterium necrophorum]|uniref:gp53-like domain-containing protein n=1 Tax=Fusobacterium necrophorum TaxID=859 RepID=UPI003D6DD9AB
MFLIVVFQFSITLNLQILICLEYIRLFSLENLSKVSFLKRENGYIEFSGFILQWGTGFSFAKTFPNACLRVITSINTQSDAAMNDDVMVTSFNRHGFKTLRGEYDVVYIAVGY